MIESLKKLLKDPAFFDIFGLLTFSYLAYIAINSLNTEKPIGRPFLVVLLLIAAGGLVVDGHIVWERFIKKIFRKIFG